MTVMNNGKMTKAMMWKSVNSDAFHFVHKVKEMGQQEHTVVETIAHEDIAFELYLAVVVSAAEEVVNPPQTGKQIVGVIDGDDDE